MPLCNEFKFDIMEHADDIIDLNDIKKLVDTFYDKVRKDALLAPIFDLRIQDRWQEHLTKMYSFWQTLLLADKTYNGNPFPPHAQLPVNHMHFQKWLALFMETVDELFRGEKAEEAKWRAQKIAEMFEIKIAYHKNQRLQSLL